MLACIAIVIVLFLIVSAGLREAKRRSYVGVDIAHLRQIGQAMAIYQAEDEWATNQSGILAADSNPFTLLALVDSGVLDKALLKSPGDPTQKGIANARLQCSSEITGRGHLPTPSYDSYPALGDRLIGAVDIVNVYADIVKAPAGGWVVSLSGSNLSNGPFPPPESCKYMNMSGSYLRLMFDGAVVHRSHRQAVNSLGILAEPPLSLYSDLEAKFP
ncbi:MAG: hypothetical protein IT203_10185 [Fimbriimonadaceae bacterium]|nr:hypothetical protein [Fimbriimonadaceae bacterium]